MDDELLKFLRDLFAAGFGAMAGSYIVFRLKECQNSNRKAQESAASLRKVQFCLADMLNCAFEYNTQSLKHVADTADRDMAMPASHIFYSSQTIDYASIGFLLSGKNAQLMQQILIAEHSFQVFLSVVKERNEAHLKVQGLVACNSVVDAALGNKLRSLTEAVFTSNADVIKKIKGILGPLAKCIEHDFPGEKALGIKVPH